MYSPTVGRFITRDPIPMPAGDRNRYRYCGNSAILEADPSGCNPILDLYVRLIQEDLDDGNPKKAAALALEMYKNIVNFGGINEPLATELMANWLRGAPKNPFFLRDIDIKGAITDKSGPYQQLSRMVTFWIPWRGPGAFGGEFDTSLLPQAIRARTGSWISLRATQGMYYHALGGFEVDFHGKWKRCGNKIELTGMWRVYDEYVWKPGKTANVAGTTIPDNYGLLVEQYYPAKPFKIFGLWNGTIVLDFTASSAPPSPGPPVPPPPNPGPQPR